MDKGLWLYGFIISAGTEGLHSVMKFMGYAKSEKKAEAGKAAGQVRLYSVMQQMASIKAQ
ncbi:MAG: hypothetical protein AAB427_16175 [Chloroflexota bacterium]